MLLIYAIINAFMSPALSGTSPFDQSISVCISKTIYLLLLRCFPFSSSTISCASLIIGAVLPAGRSYENQYD
jgi:hypothetical protein